ncbi:hypothetical protein [Chryseobacterium sp. MP_3.2]|uniref:hypothetical protein n=1 Tax=Chryseobacterium sp. MP_3.2 TaxID=3071712 RepID=UPI002E0B9F6B|nr:hypothetical protein [Chryseobacterium sp. MP_3.2]
MKKLLLSAFLLGTFTFGYSQSAYYNDYRSNVTNTNWETIAANLLLSSTQKQQLFNLNNQYPTYDSWNREYANQPARWSTDRFSSIQRIMGNDKYTKYKNKYYKGQNPVAVYNRSKNTDARKKHLTQKVKQRKNSTNSVQYSKGKKPVNVGQSKGQGKSNGKGKK